MSIHPSIHPGTKEIKEKNNLCQGLIQVSHGHPSIHPGTNEIKEKNNLCKGLIHSSCMHPSIRGQKEIKKELSMPSFDIFHLHPSIL
jgi:hypothetical protein